MKVQTNYCNNNPFTLDAKQLNKTCSGLKSSYQEKGLLQLITMHGQLFNSIIYNRHVSVLYAVIQENAKRKKLISFLKVTTSFWTTL